MNEPYNIVTNFDIINQIRSYSKYFRVSLGIANTIEDQAGLRVYNDRDKFAFVYNQTYKTTIFAQGNIGNIKFYTDHYIKEDVMAVYYDYEEFIIPYDRLLVKEKGIDAMIGFVLKKVNEEYKVRKEEIEIKKKKELEEVKPKGNAEKIFNNPGSVTYEDIKAYQMQKNTYRKI